ERQRIEHQDDVLLPAEVRQLHRRAVLVLQLEVRCAVAYLDRHSLSRRSSPPAAGQRRVPHRRGERGQVCHPPTSRGPGTGGYLRTLGATSRVPDHSLAALMLLVCESPAVCAASPMSLGSTWPSRPALGVISQMSPPLVNGTIASVRPSKRSPSSSRHHSSTTSITSSSSSSTSSFPVTAST